MQRTRESSPIKCHLSNVETVLLFQTYLFPVSQKILDIHNTFNQTFEDQIRKRVENASDFNYLEDFGMNSTEIEEIEAGTIHQEFVQVIGTSYWAVYQGIVAIVLMSILIAKITTNYTDITLNEDMEWKYKRSFMFAKVSKNK